MVDVQTQTNENLYDEFLSYSGKRGNTSYLKNWHKDGKDGQVDLWFSCLAAPFNLWRHSVPRVVELRENDEGVKETDVWGDNHVSLEDKDTNENQFFRSKVDGRRDVPPKHDPIDLLIDWVYLQVFNGKLSWMEPVFKWESDKNVRVIRAGALWNAYGSKHLNDQQKADIKKHRLVMSGPAGEYRNSFLSKLNWVFVVVQDAKPSDGLIVAIEGPGLGGKVQGLLKDRIEAAQCPQDPKGRQGNIIVNPYCMRWKYTDDKNLVGDKKFNVLRLEQRELTPEIARLIRETEPPRTDQLRRWPNLTELRLNLESHCLIQVPWDRLFEPALKLYESRGLQPNGRAPEEEDPSDGVAYDPSTVATREIRVQTPNGEGVGEAIVKSTLPSEDAARVFGDDEMVACDKCSSAMKVTDSVCAKCGQHYDLATGMPIDPPKPKLRSRSEAGKTSPIVSASMTPGLNVNTATLMSLPGTVSVGKTTFAGADLPKSKDKKNLNEEWGLPEDTALPDLTDLKSVPWEEKGKINGG